MVTREFTSLHAKFQYNPYSVFKVGMRPQMSFGVGKRKKERSFYTLILWTHFSCLTGSLEALKNILDVCWFRTSGWLARFSAYLQKREKRIKNKWNTLFSQEKLQGWAFALDLFSSLWRCFLLPPSSWVLSLEISLFSVEPQTGQEESPFRWRTMIKLGRGAINLEIFITWPFVANWY